MIGAYSGYQTELSNLIIELRDGENLTYKQIADHLTAEGIAENVGIASHVRKYDHVLTRKQRKYGLT
jgi:hypothetical protein